jgi:hypothetical protein
LRAARAAGTSTKVIPRNSERKTCLGRLHEEFLPANGLTEAGHHHEIYLSYPRKTAAGKLKTILRQLVRSAA